MFGVVIAKDGNVNLIFWLLVYHGAFRLVVSLLPAGIL